MARKRVILPPEGHSSWIWAEKNHVPLGYFFPAVMPHTANPFSGENNHRINQVWWGATRANNTAEAWLALRRNNAGWINWAANKNWGQGETVPDQTTVLPVIEGVTTIGNEVEVLETKLGMARLKTFHPDDIPYGNHETHPHLWHKFTSINRLKQMGNAPDGKESYIPLIARGDAWISLRYLEDIKEKPMGIPNDWAKGPDISRYAFSFDRSKSKYVIDFIVQRIMFADGVGVSLDPLLEKLYPNVLEVQRRGGYGFWSGFQNGKKQFDTYMEGIQGKDYHWHSADWENKNSQGVVVNPFTKDSADRMYHEFIAPIKNATGKRVVLYTQRQDFAQLRDDFKVDWLDKVDIWPKYWFWKQYTSTFNPVATVEKYWGDQYGKWILQYGGDAWNTWGWNAAKDWGIGYGAVPERRHCDVNLFPGTPAEMDAWLNIAPTPPPPTPPPPPPPGNTHSVNLKSGDTLIVKAE